MIRDEHLSLTLWTTAEHFKGTPEYFSYRAEWPVSTFVNAANTYDFQRQDLKGNRAFVEKLEKDLAKDMAGVAAHAKTLMKVSNDKAVEYLHAYNVRMLDKAQDAVANRLAEKAPWTMTVMADSINPKSDAEVKVVLFSSDKLDATKADPKRTWGGVGRASIGNKITMGQKLAKPVKAEVRDVDGDGRKDMVFTFTQKGLAQNMLAGANYDIWLHTYVDGKRVAAIVARTRKNNDTLRRHPTGNNFKRHSRSRTLHQINARYSLFSHRCCIDGTYICRCKYFHSCL